MKRINKDKYIREKLMELLEYNPETGVFKWKSDRYRRDKENLEVVTKDPLGYIRIKVFGKYYQIHRIAWLFIYGKFPKKNLDHINRVKDDNRILNLREADPTENNANTGVIKSNTSGYPGIYWDKDNQMWRAEIRHQKRRRRIGRFKTKEEAFRAYIKEKERLCGEFFNKELLDLLD